MRQKSFVPSHPFTFWRLPTCYLTSKSGLEVECRVASMSEPSFTSIYFQNLNLSSNPASALDDIPDAEILRRLIFSIREARKIKTMASFKDIHRDGDIVPGKMSHFEFNQIRPLLFQSLKVIQEARSIAEMHETSAADRY